MRAWASALTAYSLTRSAFFSLFVCCCFFPVESVWIARDLLLFLLAFCTVWPPLPPEHKQFARISSFFASTFAPFCFHFTFIYIYSFTVIIFFSLPLVSSAVLPVYSVVSFCLLCIFPLLNIHFHLGFDWLTDLTAMPLPNAHTHTGRNIIFEPANQRNGKGQTHLHQFGTQVTHSLFDSATPMLHSIMSGCDFPYILFCLDNSFVVARFLFRSLEIFIHSFRFSFVRRPKQKKKRENSLSSFRRFVYRLNCFCPYTVFR